MDKVCIIKKTSILKSSLTYSPGKIYVANGIPTDLLSCILETISLTAKTTTIVTNDCNLAIQKSLVQRNADVNVINAFNSPFDDHIDKLLGTDWGEKALLIFDSLTTLVMTAGLARTVLMLNKLSRGKVMTISVIHPECHSVDELSEICYMVDCTFGKTIMFPALTTVRLQWRKPTGKVTDQVESYILDSNGRLSSAKVVTREEQRVAEEPIPLSTFRLELSDKELDDRKQLVLPYLKTQNGAGSRGEQLSGRIVYEPDAGDDFDEDPDDDLSL